MKRHPQFLVGYLCAFLILISFFSIAWASSSDNVAGDRTHAVTAVNNNNNNNKTPFSTPAAAEDRLDRLFQAILFRETGDQEDPQAANGAAGEIGPYQITEDYFIDARDYLKRQGHDVTAMTFEDCRQYAASRRLMKAYFTRYGSDYLKIVQDPKTSETEFLDAAVALGRMHNGGPKGHLKKVTISYGNDIRQFLKR